MTELLHAEPRRARRELMKKLDELQMKLTILVWKRSGIKTVNDEVFSVTPRLRVK